MSHTTWGSSTAFEVIQQFCLTHRTLIPTRSEGQRHGIVCMKHGRPRQKDCRSRTNIQVLPSILVHNDSVKVSPATCSCTTLFYSIRVLSSLQDLISELITFGLPRHPRSVLTNNDRRWADYGRRLPGILFFTVVLIWTLCKVVHWRMQL